MKSSSLLSTLSSFSSGTSIVKTHTPNTAASNLATAGATAVSSLSSSTTPPQTNLSSLSTSLAGKLTANAIANMNSAINGFSSATSAPINLKVSLSMELLPNEKLYPTPSMSDSLAFEDEFDLRLIGCELIQTAGRLLKLPQVIRSRLSSFFFLTNKLIDFFPLF